MMQLLLYQINWPAILDLESVGTGPSSHPTFSRFAAIFCVFHQANRINHYPSDGYVGN